MLKLLAPELCTKWNLNVLMLVVVEKAIYQAQNLKLKQKQKLLTY